MTDQQNEDRGFQPIGTLTAIAGISRNSSASTRHQSQSNSGTTGERFQGQRASSSTGQQHGECGAAGRGNAGKNRGEGAPAGQSISTSRSGATEEPRSMQLLANWTPAELLPGGLTEAGLAEAAAFAEARMMPVDAKSFAVLVQPILDFAVIFGKASLSQSHREAAVEAYRKALGDLPADLLSQAVDASIKSWIYPGLPTPAEIRGHVSAEMSKRQIENGRVRMAIQRLPKPSRGTAA